MIDFTSKLACFAKKKKKKSQDKYLQLVYFFAILTKVQFLRSNSGLISEKIVKEHPESPDFCQTSR